MKSKTIVSIIAGLIMILAWSHSSIGATQEAAHDVPQAAKAAQNLPAASAETAMPPQGEGPLECMDCHRAPNIHTNEGVVASQAFCYDCHKEKTCVAKRDGVDVALQVTEADFAKNQPRHQYEACIQCHVDVARSPHKSMEGAQCLECHPVHGEGEANAPHLRVACQSCHFKSEFVKLDRTDYRVKLARQDADGKPISLAEHAEADTSDEASCKKCHAKDNTVGAPTAVLPSKSAICVLCHYSPLKIGSVFFGLALLAFLAGGILTIRFWFIGSVQGEQESFTRKLDLTSESIWKVVFSKKFFSLIKTFILDVVLQRRILKESMERWSLHSLIFTAILLRFALALFTAASFTVNPDGDMALALIDKNAPFTAFANDLLGLLALIGILWAIVRRYIIQPEHVTTEYEDKVALFLLAGLVFMGFVTEGARILVSGVPASIAGYAFVGYPLSRLFALFGETWWATFYAVLWWTHALLGALFIAWLPFGKMRHMFVTPLTYFIEAVAGVKRGERV